MPALFLVGWGVSSSSFRFSPTLCGGCCVFDDGEREPEDVDDVDVDVDDVEVLEVATVVSVLEYAARLTSLRLGIA